MMGYDFGMATKDMERVSHLEGAYEHMATKAELATLNGDYRVQFERIEHRFQSIEATMRSMQEVLVQIMERLDRIEDRLDRLESLNTRAIGFQTEGRTLRDDGDDY
ncbi:MAG: hypothetical protein F4Y88_02950 [Chloroflexi bacterium]|nr:hypothetical protein [Chloroflexota bacterium]